MRALLPWLTVASFASCTRPPATPDASTTTAPIASASTSSSRPSSASPPRRLTSCEDIVSRINSGVTQATEAVARPDELGFAQLAAAYDLLATTSRPSRCALICRTR